MGFSPLFFRLDDPNPDKPVEAKRKSRFIGELNIDDLRFKIEDLWKSLAQRRRLRRVSLCLFY